MTNNFEHLNKNEFEELKKIFYSQAYETLENIQDETLRLEAAPEDNATLKAIKRHVHTLKGDSNSFGLNDVGTLCHRIEDILSCIIDGQRNAAHEEIDLILSSADIIHRLLQESESGEKVTDSKDIVERIDNFIQKNAQQEDLSQQPEFTEYQDLQIQAALKKGLIIYEVEIVFHPMCGERTAAAFMVTKSLSGSGEIINTVPDIESGDINKAESMKIIFSSNIGQEQIEKNASITGITDKINVRVYRYIEKRLESNIKETGIKGQFLRVEVSKVDRLINLVGELIIGRSMIDQIARDIDGGRSTNDISARIFDVNSYMERTVSDLQYGIMKMRMVPVNHVFRKFPKIARDLSDEKGKKVRLEIHGKETELDKGIVDALGEPLSHLIRNSIDHGIEEPEYRRSIGKPEEGVITLRAYHEAGHIIIEASDDGRGIETKTLKEKAVEKSFLNRDELERLSDAEALNLIFLSGFSTTETVSEISGRGVGMDAVKVGIEALKGSIAIESTPGKGTKFKFSLPLTLAVIKA
jgi:two-component system chemotaxis sensor kinase CheA